MCHISLVFINAQDSGLTQLGTELTSAERRIEDAEAGLEYFDQLDIDDRLQGGAAETEGLEERMTIAEQRLNMVDEAQDNLDERVASTEA